MNRTLKILLSLSIIGAAAGVLFYSSMSEAEYYKHVHEVLKDPQRFEGTSLKVHGFVEAGSIVEEIRDQNIHRSFILEYEGQRIRVHHSGPKPDTFRDLSEVVARGTLVNMDGEFQLEAVELMAKCPSKYEENKRSREAEIAP
jgi:cytochrome c-type biogenesis protein CcmE